MLEVNTSLILLSLFLPRIIRMASVFVTHGGGPMPLIYKEEHALLYQQFQDIEKTYPSPKAIILFSAHWEES
jgi:aromatic ring-opening dioxygenase catalytic subunit (LigB family)